VAKETNEQYSDEAAFPGLIGLLGRRRLAEEGSFVLPYILVGNSVLDVGCGPGSLTEDLAVLARPGHVVGVDRDTASLTAAKARADASSVTNLHFEHASAERLPFPSSTFDVVFAHTLLEHVAEPGRVLEEMRRVTRKGGVLALRTPDWRQARFEPHYAEFERALVAFWRVHYGNSDPGIGGRQAVLLREMGCEILYEATVLVTQIGRDFARFAAERLRKAGDRQAANIFDGWQRAQPEFEQAYCEVVARA
jgi:SAM-dependent methyltransferase